MIAKLSNKRKSSIDKKIIILIMLLLIIIDIILFILIKLEKFKELDIFITKNLQEKLINKNIQSIPLFIKVVHYINGIYSPYLIITIMFNFFTVYDCFILINILSIDYLVSFCLKIIYSKPTYNYLVENNKQDKITILYCGYGWGFPSEECIVMISFYLSLWKIVCKLSMNFNNTQKIIKKLLLISLIILSVIYCFGILLMGYYFFSHIIFSIITGLIIFLFIFELDYIDLLNPHKFLVFINNKYIHFIILNLIIFIIISIIYIIAKYIPNDYQDEICKSLEEKKEKIFKSQKYYNYIDSNYFFVVLFLGNIFPILGIKIDISLIYKGNESIYLQSNFPQEWEEIIDSGRHESFAESINITKETLWNRTPLLISFLRLIVVLLFFGICFTSYFLIQFEYSNLLIILSIKILLPIILLLLGIFFFFKPILKLMKLTNFTLESILDDR